MTMESWKILTLSTSILHFEICILNLAAHLSEMRLSPDYRGLQPEGLLPARGVARSDFRPLSNILDCGLP